MYMSFSGHYTKFEYWILLCDLSHLFDCQQHCEEKEKTVIKPFQKKSY